MGTFNSSKDISSPLTDVKPVLNDVREHFESKGFTVTSEETVSGGFISITKGGLFKTALGMKTSLNTDIRIHDGTVSAEAKVGIFGEQLLPSLISLFVAWPVLIGQIAGMVSQSQLDEEMISVIEQSVRKHENEKMSSSTEDSHFCTSCGKPVPAAAAFCPSCGAKQ